MKTIKRLLIANRGEIAKRIARACQALGITPILLYTDAQPLSAYLDIDRIIKIAKSANADAIHPGYGFLSENPKFPEACAQNKIIFVGPTAETMRQMGNKVAAKQLMQALGVPTVPGVMTDLSLLDPAVIAKIGYPVLIKAAAGGGGKGMRVVETEAGLCDAIAGASREAKSAFGDGTVFIEKYIRHPRHVEIQVLGDTQGHVIHLFERDCSSQRRHQKIVEESPSPALTPALRAEMGAAAVKISKSVNYVSAGTLEFLVDADHNYYFLEMNTRLQVEHAVTEEVCGLDLVQWQLRIAAGEPLVLQQAAVTPRGHAIECRIYAEDPRNQFLPAIGRVQCLREPSGAGVRVESALSAGMQITVDFDPMLSKLVVHAPTRAEAIVKMLRALSDYHIAGVTTNLPFLQDLLRSHAFAHGNIDTHFVETFVQHWSEFPGARNDPFSPWHAPITTVTADLIRGPENAGCRVKPGMTKRAKLSKIAGSLTSPMPGRVVKVLVAEGDSVQAGDTLLVMEAMKMEHSIKAPAAGVVVKLHCHTGDMIESGKKLVEVE